MSGKWICGDCAHEQDSDRPCDECLSMRMLPESLIADCCGGEDWRDFPTTPICPCGALIHQGRCANGHVFTSKQDLADLNSAGS